MDDTVTAATTTGIAPIGPPDFITPLVRQLFSGEVVGGLTVASVVGWLSAIWSVYVILAYIASALFLYGFIYATLRVNDLVSTRDNLIKEQEKLFQASRGKTATNTRWQEVLTHVNSENPNDWRLAIIEADIMLEDALKQAGYAGTTLGERLRGITPNQLQSIDDAWTAHRVRNEIAHAGADFVLTKRLANDTIAQFERTFKELGVV